MADNYLENRMEEYRRRRPAAAHYTPAYRSPGAELPMCGVRVLVDAGMEAPVPELVAALVNAGCRVAFRCSDAASGNRLAQATGARALPLDRERAAQNLFRAWGGVDVLIAAEADPGYAATVLERSRCGAGKMLLLNELTAENIVRMCS